MERKMREGIRGKRKEGRWGGRKVGELKEKVGDKMGKWKIFKRFVLFSVFSCLFQFFSDQNFSLFINYKPAERL